MPIRGQVAVAKLHAGCGWRVRDVMHRATMLVYVQLMAWMLCETLLMRALIQVQAFYVPACNAPPFTPTVNFDANCDSDLSDNWQSVSGGHSLSNARLVRNSEASGWSFMSWTNSIKVLSYDVRSSAVPNLSVEMLFRITTRTASVEIAMANQDSATVSSRWIGLKAAGFGGDMVVGSK